jgi:hypothetical protein
MGRRSRFFLIAAAACAVLIPVTDASLRYVPIVLAITYVVLALASHLDERSRHRQRR